MISSASTAPTKPPKAVKGEPHSRNVDATNEAKASLTPELVIALCGPIGSPLHEAADQITNTLVEFSYSVERIRLSELIRINAQDLGISINEDTEFSRVKSLIEAGDQLRKKFGNDILAKLGVAKIGADRDSRFGPSQDKADDNSLPTNRRIKSHRICHVIDSIKNKSELELLRLIYGDVFFAIGIFSPLDIRKINMQQPGVFSQTEIGELINTDSGEEFSHGQSVRDTFPMCDIFLRVDHPVIGPTAYLAVSQIVEKARRFFDLIFKTAIVTPTAEETAMYASASAARNSACLSRQVGAAVTSSSGEVLAVGWNDVPQSGGGLYGKPPLASPQAAHAPPVDHRCWALQGGKCHNDEEKKLITEKVVNTLIENGLLSTSDGKRAIDVISKDSRVKDLIEFSRAVHAEMHAILVASRIAGDRVIGGKIFVTTYPCHLCARHIVASGISEVYYIEPYRKSLATKLHSDSLSESIGDSSKVRLLQFDGVAPRRFIDLFEAGERKRNGSISMQRKNIATPSMLVSMKAIPRLEQVVVAEVTSKKLRLPKLVDTGGKEDEQSKIPQPAA